MNPQIVLALCFTPLVVIYIVMKIAVWLSAVNAESDYVRKEPLRQRDPMWRTHMQTLMKRKRSMEIAQIIDNAIDIIK